MAKEIKKISFATVFICNQIKDDAPEHGFSDLLISLWDGILIPLAAAQSP